MEIRRAASKDYKQLMTLYDDFMETDRYASLNNDSFQKIIGSKHNFILVGEEGSRITGFITASARLVVRYPQRIMQVDELYVDPDFRKHGLGGSLLKAIEQIARENGFHRIYIESATRLNEAHQFYEHNAYKKSGYYFLKTL
jgi:PhnO protein